MKKLSFLLVIVLIAFLARSAYQQSVHQIAANPQTASAVVTTTKAGDVSIYPDLHLTPGGVLTTDASVVCRSGYSSSVRNVPVSEKRLVYQEYGVSYPEPQGSYEVDHLISLELGGSNDIKNLWPEPANPKPGFHEKDVIENYLHSEVCSGKMSLSEAQREISTDWYAVYLKVK